LKKVPSLVTAAILNHRVQCQIILLVPGVSYRVGKGIHIRGCSYNAKWWKFYWNWI